MNFLQWLTSSIGTTAVLGGVVFFARDWIIKRLSNSIQYEYDKKLARVKGEIDHEYATQLTTLKSQLQSESGIVIARLESQLQIATAEKSIKLTEVFGKQAEIIAETYSKLTLFVGAVKNYATPLLIPPIEERRNKVLNFGSEFMNYYDSKRIYFPKQTQFKIDELCLQFSKVTMEFIQNVELHMIENPTASPKDDTFQRTMDFIYDQCPKIMDTLDSDFKHILGLPANTELQ